MKHGCTYIFFCQYIFSYTKVRFVLVNQISCNRIKDEVLGLLFQVCPNKAEDEQNAAPFTRRQLLTRSLATYK